jgi:transcriptional regulator with XRE-family HTH domain
MRAARSPELAGLARRLQRLREERGLTKQQLGAALGLSNVAIGQWERHEKLPGAESLVRLCRYFQVSAQWLLGLGEE